MTEYFIYALPAIAFLVVGGLLAWGLMFWSQHFSERAKAARKRLQSVAAGRNTGDSRLFKVSGDDQTWLRWIRESSAINWLNTLLAQSGSEKSASQIIWLCLGLGSSSMAILRLVTPIAFWQIAILSILVGSIPVWFYLRRQAMRRQRFEDQFPEALDFLSRALRAGHSLPLSLGMLGDEMPDPVGPEFKMAFDEINFGVSFGDAMSHMASRINSADLWFFVAAVMIQRETGGNLAELLEKLAYTVRERIKLAGKVRILSSEGRTSGIILGVMPFAMAFLMTLINPNYMAPLWGTPSGHKAIAYSLVMMAVGGLWIRKIIRLKV